MKSWQRWQDAQSNLQKKREIEARLLWANKPDKLQQAKDEISEVSDEYSVYKMRRELFDVYAMSCCWINVLFNVNGRTNRVLHQ